MIFQLRTRNEIAHSSAPAINYKSLISPSLKSFLNNFSTSDVPCVLGADHDLRAKLPPSSTDFSEFHRVRVEL